MCFERALFRVSAAAIFCAGAYANGVISNGNFSTGLTGWTIFTAPDGTTSAGESAVAAFTPESLPGEAAVQFDVTQATSSGMNFEGGGLSQTVSLAAAMVNGSIDVGAPGGTSFNLSGGFSDEAIDSQPVAGYNFGSLQSGQVVSSTLTVGEMVAGGSQMLGVELMLSTASPATAPFQSASNFQSAFNFNADEFTDVPEPSTIALILFGIAGLAGCKAMRGRTHHGRSARPRVI